MLVQNPGRARTFRRAAKRRAPTATDVEAPNSSPECYAYRCCQRARHTNRKQHEPQGFTRNLKYDLEYLNSNSKIIGIQGIRMLLIRKVNFVTACDQLKRP